MAESRGPSVTGLSHIELFAPTREVVEDTVRFYARLGFAVVAEEPEGNTWLRIIQAADVKLDELSAAITLKISVVVKPPKAGEAAAGRTVTFSWTITNLDQLQEELKSAEYPYAHPVHHGNVVSHAIIVVSDPCGNRLFLSKSATIFGGATQVPSAKISAAIAAALLPQATVADRPKKPKPADVRRRIGILTSGGDSSGMNAAVRSITRVALQKDYIPYAIYEGYQGLVDGGSYIKELGWEDVRGLLAVGGTSIGTARCLDFRSRAGRLKGALNLLKNGIDALVVIGGDGSLTGADLLRSEWPGLVKDLIETGQITEDACGSLKDELTLVGMVGSIDNDMSGTDITIGAVTSLHRICEAVDNLTSTALSHQRAFVVEVMGRHCGWLGLMAGIACGADWVFLPERPPPLNTDHYGDDWESEMCDTIKKYREVGNRKSMVIVCEGAVDRHLRPIKPDHVQKVLTERLGLDTRVTCLGHVQRGGTPCAFDRYLATVQGVKAVEAVLESKPGSPSPMIGISHNEITATPLMEAVKLTHAVAEAIGKKDFAKAMELRDPNFTAIYNAFLETTVHSLNKTKRLKPEECLRIAIIHTGAPAGGMNAATRTAARICLSRGHTVLGIRNGFTGLVNDEVSELNWHDTVGWQVLGGSALGTNRDHPSSLPGGPKVSPKGDGSFVDIGLIAYHMQKHNIQALLLIGGFEAYTSQLTLTDARRMFPIFRIPMVQLPATVSNNVPGTEYSIGSDTALNVIVEACDRIKLSANASRKRVFVVEVQGGSCGYLATMGALATGATTVYIPEDGISIDKLQADIKHIVHRYKEEDRKGIPNEGRLILRSELASKTYTTDTISNILRAEGKGLFDSRTAVLGHLQQGGIPSPLDRIRATRLAVNCVDWIQEIAAKARTAPEMGSTTDISYQIDNSDSIIIGIVGADIMYTPVDTIITGADFETRRGKDQWWMNVKQLIRILSKYEYVGPDSAEIDLLKNRDNTFIYE